MKKALLLLTLCMSISSFASIESGRAANAAVNKMEVIYQCDGLLPDVTVPPTTNVVANELGEVRLPEHTIHYRGYEVFFQGKHIGTVTGSPTCLMKSTKHNHEVAEPSVNAIELDPGLALTLSAQADGSFSLSFDQEIGSVANASQ